MIQIKDTRTTEDKIDVLRDIPNCSVFRLSDDRDGNDYVKIGLMVIKIHMQKLEVLDQDTLVIVGKAKANIDITIFE